MSESPRPRLLVIDSAYSWDDVEAKAIRHSILSRSLDGFFDHVWSVHPFVGANPHDASNLVLGPPHEIAVASDHTAIDCPIGRFSALADVRSLNFLVAQIALWLRLFSLIRRERISVVRVGDPHYLGVFGWTLARASKIPYAVRINGNYDKIYAATGRLAYPRLLRSRRVETLLARFVLRRANIVFAPSEDNLEFARRNGARPDALVLARYGGLIDPVHLVEPDAVPRPVEVPPDRPYLLWVGRLEEVKYPLDVLEAFSTVRSSVDNAVLVFAGDGALRAELEDRAHQLQVADSTVFVGSRDQHWLMAAMRNAAVNVSTMSGRALVEACLSGRAVAAYDFEWQGEIISDGVTGLLAPFRDRESLARQLVRLLRDPDFGIQLGSAARSAVLSLMGPDNVLAGERQAYRRILTSCSAMPSKLDSQGASSSLTVLFISTGMSIGGIEANILLLARELIARQHRVTVVAQHGTLVPELEAVGARYVAVPKRGRLKGLVGAVRSLRRVLRDESPDVIHCYSAWAMVVTLMGRVCARSHDRPAIVSSVMGLDTYSGEAHWRVATRVFLTCVGATRICVISPAIAAVLTKLPLRRSRMRDLSVVGIDVPPSLPERTTVGKREALAITPHKAMVMTVGRLVNLKRHDLFIRAAAEVLSHRSDVQFLIVGEGEDEDSLRAQIAATGHAGDIRLLGPRRDIGRLMQACDVYVRPGTAEGFIGITVLEALAAGTPVIAFETEDVKLAVQDGQTGILVPPDDTHALATAIEALLDDPVTAARLGAAGYDLVREKYSIQNVVPQLEQLYRETLVARRTGR
ncbi:MAG TPA: glycosyltransferase family 4 protein [Acidimicrobiales bacterium]|nr:glycosyltransferase family 4 protein [Acidimicrobiales bacterium]